MRQAIREGLGLAEQLAGLPFKAARQAFAETPMSSRPLGDVVRESMEVGEGLARLPFKAAAALLAETAAPPGPSLEERVAELERRLGVDPAAPTSPAG